MPDYVQPQDFTDGQIAGRAQLGVLYDNDRYFHALADRWRCVPNGVRRDYVGTETSIDIWDGYHLLRSDATTLYYHMVLENDDGAHPSTISLYYDYGGAGQTLIATRSTTGTSASTYDLSTFYGTYGEGLYRVYCKMSRSAPDVNYNAYGTLRAPYTRYTGALSFTTPPTITDAATSSYSDWNKWCDNDAFFYANRPPQPAFVAPARGFIGTETSLVIWDGWVKHNHERIQYLVDLEPDDDPSNSNNNRIKIYYGYGDALQETVLNTASVGETESYYDLLNAFVAGTWYRVTVVITRDDGNLYGQTATIKYLFASPTAADAGFTDQGALAVGQYVYGDTVGQDTRLALLSSNDTNLDGRIDRLDYAVRKAAYEDLGDSGGTWHYRLMRRYDTLYYRGTNLNLQWGTDESQALDDVTSGYGTLDLRSLSSLHYGTIYRITSGTKEFAMEA